MTPPVTVTHTGAPSPAAIVAALQAAAEKDRIEQEQAKAQEAA
jgi:Ni,Fe-hydrogenase III small subunit